MLSRRTAVASLLAGCLLLLVALFLWFDNPTVDVRASDLDGSGPAGKVACSIAPWDAGLNDNSGGPGGEHSDTYVDEVAAECYSANTTRFNAAVASGVLGLLMVSVPAIVEVRSRRPEPTAS